MSKLKPFPMAFAIGMTWGLGILLLGWISGGGWGARLVEVLSSLYVGYSSTFVGGLIGGLWAFADGFIAGLIVAGFYNRFAGFGLAEQVPHVMVETRQPAH
jgi:hypothetical protein